MGLLDGKKGLILNVANDRSIAWHIGHNAIQHGATCGFGYLVIGDADKSLRRAKKSIDELGAGGEVFLHQCDVGSDESIAAFFAAAKDRFGTIDFLVHSLAFANKDYLKKELGVFTEDAAGGVRRGLQHQRVQPDRPHPRRPAAHAGWRLGRRDELLRGGEGHPRLQRDGRRQGRPGGDRPLPGVRPRRARRSASTASPPARSAPWPRWASAASTRCSSTPRKRPR